MVKESATGSTTSSKIRLNLTIQVERLQFDPDTCVLRLSGRNREETEHVKVSTLTRLALNLSGALLSLSLFLSFSLSRFVGLFLRPIDRWIDGLLIY